MGGASTGVNSPVGGEKIGCESTQWVIRYYKRCRCLLHRVKYQFETDIGDALNSRRITKFFRTNLNLPLRTVALQLFLRSKKGGPYRFLRSSQQPCESSLSTYGGATSALRV